MYFDQSEASKSKMAGRGPQNGRRCLVNGHFEPLSQNKYLDPSTPSMRKVDDGEKIEKNGVLVATTSLPAVDRSNADPWNAARQFAIAHLKNNWNSEMLC